MVTMGEWQQAMAMRKRREQEEQDGRELQEGVGRRLAGSSTRDSGEDEDGGRNALRQHRPAFPYRLLDAVLNFCMMLLLLPVRVVLALFSDEAPWEPSTPEASSTTRMRPLYRQPSQSSMGTSLALDAVCGLGWE